jgi:hypothetical protein
MQAPNSETDSYEKALADFCRDICIFVCDIRLGRIRDFSSGATDSGLILKTANLLVFFFLPMNCSRLSTHQPANGACIDLLA